MALPVYPTAEIAEDAIAEIEAEFAKRIASLRETVAKKKLPCGEFKFTFNKSYKWANDEGSRATLRISTKAFSKMMLLMQTTSLEVGWHGLIKRVGEHDASFILEDILLYPQTVTAATIDADQQKYPLWAMDLPMEQFTDLRFHGHSHVNMGCTPSGTDMNFREDLIGQFSDGFYVFMIINKKLEHTIQIYDFQENNLYDTKDVDVYVGDAADDDFGKEIKDANSKMVATRTTYYGSNYYGGGKTTGYPPAVPQSGAPHAGQAGFRTHPYYGDYDYYSQLYD